MDAGGITDGRGGLRSVCVYCGARSGRSPAFAALAADFGRRLAEQGLRLVYGGGRLGLMGALADAALAAGGEVVGVIPRALVEREVAHTGLSELQLVDGMHPRKARMMALADAIVALPGGYGTLDELCEALTWAQLGLHDKPVALLDLDGYYAPLVEFFAGAERGGLLTAANRARLLHDEDPHRLLQRLRQSLVREAAAT